jgi:hypothetical protein
MQNGSKLGHSKYQEKGPKSWIMGNKVGKIAKSRLKQYGLLQNPSE